MHVHVASPSWQFAHGSAAAYLAFEPLWNESPGLAANNLHVLAWAARYNTWRLMELTPKGVVFSFLYIHVLVLVCSISPQKTNRHSPSKQGSIHVPVWASFGGPTLGSADYNPLMGQPPSHPADPTQVGAILTSPRMSSPGPQEAARPMLDVEFTNMGMRLKGTGRKVLAGVTGRLRESRMTAIMGPSGAGGGFLCCLLGCVG